MFAEEDLRPISALQHLLFCERQCALIHVEQLWAENELTVMGKQLHERVDAGRKRARRERVTTRSLMLRSLTLGLFGKADVVEFHPSAGEPASAGGNTVGDTSGNTVGDTSGRTVGDTSGNTVGDTSGHTVGDTVAAQHGAVPFPVEYKRGKPKAHDADLVQLCAQALCLEEMLGVPVPAGALFYGQTRRRQEVAFDASLRALTLRTIERLHEMLGAGVTPRARREKKCERCSLLHLCLPEVLEGSESASQYVRRAIGQIMNACGGTTT